MLLEAEPQLLRRQLEDEQRAHLATCEDTARASRQLRVHIAALENENRRLHKALEHARNLLHNSTRIIPFHILNPRVLLLPNLPASSSSASTQSNET